MKNIEIENKYLLSRKKAMHFIKGIEILKVKHIEQFYIKYGKNSIKRARKSDDEYILTVKRGSGRIREEIEKNISKKRYKKLSKKRIGYKIVKKRYIFKLEEKTYELDIFKKKFKNLSFLEIEFQNEEDLNSFTLPSTLKELVVKDVSEDKNYTNSSLALRKYQKMDIEKYLDNIDKGEFDKSDITIKKEVNIHIYLSIKLYLYLYLTKKYAAEYLQTKEDESLHQFRINIRKIRSLLYLHREFFQKNIYKSLNKSLKQIASATNFKRDLDVFIKKVKDFDMEDSSFFDYLTNLSQEEDKKIEQLLKSEDFNDTLFNLELFLKVMDFYSFETIKLPAMRYAHKKIEKNYKRVKEESLKLKPSSPIEEYHKIRIEIKKLRYLMEFYSINKKRKRLVKLQNDFGKLNDTYNQIKIIKNYILQNEADNNKTDKILKALQKDQNSLKHSILTKITFL